MILYQQKPTLFFLRCVRAVFSPVLILFVPIGPLVYFALQGNVNEVQMKAMWVGACVMLLLSILIYYNFVKSVITLLTEVDLSNEGLKIRKVKYDKSFEVFIPIKDVQLRLTTYRNKNASRSGEWHSYVLQFFNAKSTEPECVINEPEEVLKEILEKIERQNLIRLNASEKDFLLLANRPKKFSALKTYVKAKQIVALLTIIFVIYKVVPFVQSISFVKENGITGSWRVTMPEESFGMTITFAADSTATESIFNTAIKWKIKTVDSLTSISFLSEDTNGWSGYEYAIISRDDTTMNLKRNFDQRLFRLVKVTSVPGELSEFKKMAGVCDRSFLMPISRSVENELLNKYLLDWLPDQRPVKTLLRDRYLVVLLDGSTASYVAVFNLGNELLLSHKNFESVQGECSHTFSTVIKGGDELILNEYQCMEEAPILTYYQIADNGNLMIVNEANKAPSNQWVSIDSFRNFPGKWFPLFEGVNGLERQQLCGTEGFIEIIENEKIGGFVWREQGYQSVWEAVIQNFEVAGIELFVHQFLLEPHGGPITEINVVSEEAHAGVMLFNGKPYTKQPDLFPINNSADCP